MDILARYVLEILRGHDVSIHDYGYGIRYSYVELCIDDKCFLGVNHTLLFNLRGKKPYMDELDPYRVVEYVSSIDPYLKQLGHCIINAVNQYLMHNGYFGEYTHYDKDPIDIVDLRDKRVVFIGDVRPIVDYSHRVARETYVFEADPCRRDIAYPEFYYYRILGDADIVFITGSTLTNDSIDEILRYTCRDAIKILIGPSASVPLKPVIDIGIDIIASMHIPPENTEIVRKGIIRGGGTRMINRFSRKYVQVTD